MGYCTNGQLSWIYASSLIAQASTTISRGQICTLPAKPDMSFLMCFAHIEQHYLCYNLYSSNSA